MALLGSSNQSSILKKSISQRGKLMLDCDGYQFQCNKRYKSKNGVTVLYWHCERKYDMGCAVKFSTDDSAHGTRCRCPVCRNPFTNFVKLHFAF